MLDPGKDPSTFDVIADDVSRANACWPDRISNLLISDLWRNKFDSQSLGWNEYKACLVLFPDEPYDPDEPSRWVSKSVAREADRGRPGTFRPMSRDIAFNMLLAVDEPLVSGVIDEAGEPKFRLLAEIELRHFGAKAQEILGDIAITNDEVCHFCDWHGLKRPKSYEQEPPQEKPRATPEVQTAQGSEPLSEIELNLKGRAQRVLEEGHIIQDRNNWRLSTRTIASIMIKGADGQQFKGWGDETLRAILDGRHNPSLRLGLKRLVKK